MRCDCGNPAKYQVVISLQLVSLCADCFAFEFPERAATYALVARAPDAPEFNDPAL